MNIQSALMVALSVAVLGAAPPSPGPALVSGPPSQVSTPDLDAWSAAKAMGVGINVGNTLENTATWETGWGNPLITKAYIDALAAQGFKTVRLPVAWDTYAKNGQINPSKLKRVGQVVDWVTSAGMFCVINIHWDGGWIDSDDQKRFAKTYRTFSPEAELKFRGYWSQIATYFADRDQHLIFEGINEESNFERAGSEKQAYATLKHVNQLFIDTTRASGGNNARRLLIIAGYSTDIEKTTNGKFVLPNDLTPHKLLLSVHYYTPWPFAGMTHDESWGKMRMTWGNAQDVAELRRNFDKLEAYSKANDIPVFVGEFAAADSKDQRSRAKWMAAVAVTALSRDMIPVLWDVGNDMPRKPPYKASPALNFALKQAASFDESATLPVR